MSSLKHFSLEVDYEIHPDKEIVHVIWREHKLLKYG